MLPRNFNQQSLQAKQMVQGLELQDFDQEFQSTISLIESVARQKDDFVNGFYSEISRAADQETAKEFKSEKGER